MAALVPIEFTPKIIRDAFIAQLVLKNVAGGNVVSTRPTPFSADDVPAVNVFSPGSDSPARSGGHLPTFKTTIKIVCAGTVTLAEGGEFETKNAAIGDAVDALEIAIKTAILGDVIFARSFAGGWVGLRVQKGFTTEGKRFRATVNIEFSLSYDESYPLTNIAEDPLPDLEQVEILTALDGFVRLVTHDGDRLVTHDGDRLNLGGAPTILSRPIYRVRLITHGGDNLVTHKSENIVTHDSQGFEAA